VNLDYRSLYQHFECGCLLYGCDCLADIKADYLAILEQCRQITPAECKRGYFKRLEEEVLRLISPLL
jgi:cardiolipin synthase